MFLSCAYAYCLAIAENAVVLIRVVSVPVVCALVHGFWRLVFSGVGSSRCVLKQFGEK